MSPDEREQLISYAYAMRAAQGFELTLAVAAIRIRRKTRPLGIRRRDSAETLATRITTTLTSGQAPLTRATASTLAKEIAPELPEDLATAAKDAAALRNSLAHDFFRKGQASAIPLVQQAASAREARRTLESVTARILTELDTWVPRQAVELPEGQLPIPDNAALDALLLTAVLSLMGGSVPSMEAETLEFARAALAAASQSE